VHHDDAYLAAPATHVLLPLFLPGAPLGARIAASYTTSTKHQNRSTEPPRVARATLAALPRTTSSARASGWAWARRLTITLPLTGKNTTLRGWMSSTSSETMGMRSVAR